MNEVRAPSGPPDDRFDPAQPPSSARRIAFNALEEFFTRPVVMLLPLIVLTVFGVFTAVSAEKEYRSTGTIDLSSVSSLASVPAGGTPTAINPDPIDTATNLGELLYTDAFTADIVERAGLTRMAEAGFFSYAGIRRTVAIKPRGEQLLVVSVTTETPELSQRIASGTIDAFIAFIVDSSVASDEDRIEALQQRIIDHEARLAIADRALDDYIDAHGAATIDDGPDSEWAVLDRLTNTVIQAESDLASARSAVSAATSERDVAEDTVRRYLNVIDVPDLPTSPTNGLPDMAATVAIFFVAGLGIFATFAVLAGFLDRTVRSPEDLDEQFGLPVVAELPVAR